MNTSTVDGSRDRGWRAQAEAGPGSTGMQPAQPTARPSGGCSGHLSSLPSGHFLRPRQQPSLVLPWALDALLLNRKEGLWVPEMPPVPQELCALSLSPPHPPRRPPGATSEFLQDLVTSHTNLSVKGRSWGLLTSPVGVTPWSALCWWGDRWHPPTPAPVGFQALAAGPKGVISVPFKQGGLLGDWMRERSSSAKFSGEGGRAWPWVGEWGGRGLGRWDGGGGGTPPPLVTLPSPTPSPQAPGGSDLTLLSIIIFTNSAAIEPGSVAIIITLSLLLIILIISIN